MAAAYKLALPAMRAIEELLPQYIHAVEARKKKNESVNEWLAEATACRRCETPFVRVERPEHPRLVGHFGPVYGIACKRCNASVCPPPELHLMLRAEEFLKAALSLNRPASSEERPTHVVLFLLYHVSELYLKCLGTYTYYIGDTPIDLATYETEKKEDPDEEPAKVFLSHTLTHGFARIPRPVQHRLVYFAKEQKTNIKKVVPLRDRCSFGRLTWLISHALTVTYVVGEHRLYLERNCRLPESCPQETAESRGACQFQGAEQSARVRPSGRTSAKVEAAFHGFHGSSPCKCQRLSTLR